MKDKRFRSAKYLKFVRSLPCVLCGGQANAAHHITGMWSLSGMGLKAPDSFSMPVCDGPGDTCHRKIHASPGLQQSQPTWLRWTIRAALADREAGFDTETRDELVHALAFIEARQAL